MNKNLLQLFAVLLLTACANAPHAGGLVDVSVIDRQSGERLKLYRHQGRLYVAGRPGNNYAVSLQNKTSGRTLTVLSVDGVNAISGETAAVQQSGYVLESYTSAEITGWRKSMSEVAAFVFTALPQSYAARTGRPDNVGVIGVAVFREYLPPEPEVLMAPPASQPRANEESAAASQGTADMARAKKAEKLGTGHGQRETSPVQYTEFQRASERPAEMIQIYYDSYANLVARGVIPVTHPAKYPNPFPSVFVPDPA
jgi:hypothetical protein